MSAIFSPCGRYRHQLTRPGEHYCGWIMLNPSVADGSEDDPTLRKVRGFAKDWGYSGVIVNNLYDLVSTDPKGLWEPGVVPSSPDNDAYLYALAMLPLVVVAWGANARPDRIAQVLKILKTAGTQPFCLGINGNGSPKHPLYIPYSQTLRPYTIDGTVSN